MPRWLKYGIYSIAFFLSLGTSAYLATHFIIKGQEDIKVPDLTGKTAADALIGVSDLGLNVRVLAVEFSDAVPKDHIITQEPPPDAWIKKDRVIKVVLSKGMASVNLPDVSGLSLTQVKPILEQSRLRVGRVSYTHGSGPDQERHRVICQVPDPFTTVKVGDQVDLLVSLGPRPTYMTMPDLTSMPYSQALFTLERSGLNVGRIETDFRPDWPLETVVLQDPAPGGRVARNTPVRLTMNVDPESNLAEYRVHLLDYRVPFGLFRRKIRVRVTAGSYLVDLYDRWHEPGQTIRITALVRGNPRAQVFDDGEEKSLSLLGIYSEGVLNDQNRPLYPFGRLLPTGG